MRRGLSFWVAIGVVLGTTLASWMFGALDLTSSVAIGAVACAAGLLLGLALRLKRAP